MRTKIIFLVASAILAGTVHAQTLAIRDDAEEAEKVVLSCSSYSTYNVGNPSSKQTHNDKVDVTIQKKSNKEYIVSPSNTSTVYSLPLNTYSKTATKDATSRCIELVSAADASQASYGYSSSIGNNGQLNSILRITDKGIVNEYLVDKCVFVGRDGVSHTYYSSRTSRIDNDLVFYFLNAIKTKNKTKNDNASTSSYDDESSDLEVSYGIKGGGDYIHYWGDAKKWIRDGRFGYHAGVFVECRFGNMAVAPEVLFATAGTKNYLERDGHDWDAYYINVPIMFKYYVTPSFSVELGPQAGFNIYSKEKWEKPKNPNLPDKGTETMSEEVNAKLFEIGAGGGFTWNIGRHFLVQARYTMGFTNVIKNISLKSGNVQLAIGYRF